MKHLKYLASSGIQREWSNQVEDGRKGGCIGELEADLGEIVTKCGSSRGAREEGKGKYVNDTVYVRVGPTHLLCHWLIMVLSEATPTRVFIDVGAAVCTMPFPS